MTMVLKWCSKKNIYSAQKGGLVRYKTNQPEDTQKTKSNVADVSPTLSVITQM